MVPRAGERMMRGKLVLVFLERREGVQTWSSKEPKRPGGIP